MFVSKIKRPSNAVIPSGNEPVTSISLPSIAASPVFVTCTKYSNVAPGATDDADNESILHACDANAAAPPTPDTPQQRHPSNETSRTVACLHRTDLSPRVPVPSSRPTPIHPSMPRHDASHTCASLSPSASRNHACISARAFSTRFSHSPPHGTRHSPARKPRWRRERTLTRPTRTHRRRRRRLGQPPTDPRVVQVIRVISIPTNESLTRPEEHITPTRTRIQEERITGTLPCRDQRQRTRIRIKLVRITLPIRILRHQCLSRTEEHSPIIRDRMVLIRRDCGTTMKLSSRDQWRPLSRAPHSDYTTRTPIVFESARYTYTSRQPNPFYTLSHDHNHPQQADDPT